MTGTIPDEPVGAGGPLQVGLDARLENGRPGGVQQFVIGLARGLSQLENRDEEYLFLTEPGLQTWLGPHLGPGARILETGSLRSKRAPDRWYRALRRAAGVRLPRVRTGWRRIRRSRRDPGDGLARSDGTIEGAGVDVMHFTFQNAFLTEVPSIYQPWDLQHVHLPDFFTEEARRWRELAYGAYCSQARVVVVASEWAKRDVVHHYGLPWSKVAVIGVPPVASSYPEPDLETMAEVARRFGLPPSFVLYPAQTWPHKNHIRLLAALAALRDRSGLSIDLVCSGSQNSHHATVRAEVQRLRLDRTVHFVGFVEPLEMQALFRLSRAVVFPSLFEGWGLPVLEAFEIGVPVACSSVTSLPDLVGDAALIFDPLDVDAIAASIARLWHDDELRAELVVRGHRVAARFDWATAARIYRAHYRALSGRPISFADQALINASIERPPG